MAIGLFSVFLIPEVGARVGNPGGAAIFTVGAGAAGQAVGCAAGYADALLQRINPASHAPDLADVAGGIEGAPGFDHQIHSYDPKTVSGLGDYLKKHVDSAIAAGDRPLKNINVASEFAPYIDLRNGKVSEAVTADLNLLNKQLSSGVPF